jgi:hypothetical protein
MIIICCQPSLLSTSSDKVVAFVSLLGVAMATAIALALALDDNILATDGIIASSS